jgi:hypothetical protein
MQLVSRPRWRSALLALLALTCLAGWSAAPAPADSLRSDGVRLAGSSRDAREVFFLSPDRLLPADRDRSGDLYESAGGRLSLVATGAGQAGGAEDASFRYATPDGSRVFFQTSKRLLAADTDSAIDVYERSPGGLALVSTGPGGGGAEPARFQAATPDGSHAIFATTAALTPDDGDEAVDLYERAAGLTALITPGTAQGVVALNRDDRGTFGVPRRRAAISSDGQRVIFATAERLSTSDVDDQVDLYEAGPGTLQAGICGGRPCGVSIRLLSTGPADGGTCPAVDCDAELEAVSPDASRIVIDTRAALVADDSDGANDLYGISPTGPELLSVGATGQNEEFPGFLAASADATHVIFASGAKLTADDRDPYSDIFERAGGRTTLVSGGRLDRSFAGATEPGVEFAGASADLSRVFFETYEGLLRSDRYGDMDLYQHAGRRTTIVSGSRRDPKDENSTIEFQGCSANGRTVLFKTEDSLVAGDRGEEGDLYARRGRRLLLISRGFRGRQGGGPRVVAHSADGRRIVFASLAQLSRRDRDRSRDLYEWFRGRVRLLSGPRSTR